MTVRRVFVFLYFFVLQFEFNPLMGQESESFQFKKLKLGQELSSGNIQTIFRDNDGIMWFGTSHGINRFDGTQLKFFFSDESDSTALSQNAIYKIFNGPEDNLWIKGLNKVFNIYLKEQGIFERNLQHFSKKYQLMSDNINMIHQDSKKRFWFSHPFEGISLYDRGQSNTRYFSQNSMIPGSLSYNSVSYINEDYKGNFWIVYQNGTVDILDGNSLNVVKSLRIDRYLDPALSYHLEIFLDSSGDAWVFCPDYALGLFFIDGKDFSIQYINDQSEGMKLNNGLVKTIMEYPEGKIWVGTDHGGINIIDKELKTVSYVLHQPEDPRSLSHNAVYSLFKDDEETVWVGTHKRGIDVFNPHYARFDLVRKEIDAAQPYPFNDVNAFEEDESGNIIVGTNGAGLWKYNPQTDQRIEWNLNLENAPGPDLVVVDLYKDRQGTLWIGTYQQGLFAFDGVKFQHYVADFLREGALKDNNIWKIFEDSKNRLWLGTLREGLMLLDRETGHFTHFPEHGEKLKLNNHYITAIEEDKDGNIWVGGSEGIDVFNLETGFRRYFPGSPNDPSGLISKHINDFFKDNKDVIWVTTTKGLYYFDGEKESFNKYNIENGLPVDFLVSGVADREGNIWLSAQGGLIHAKVDRSQNIFILNFGFFNEGDGVQGSYFNKNAFLISKKGKVYFGGSDGFNQLDPEKFPFRTEEPKIIFSEFQLFNQAISVNQQVNGRNLLEAPLDKNRILKLKHDENIFSISFSALNYLNPEKSKFLYQLEGFNENWINLSEPPFRVTYTNLDPGNYTLKVRAANSDGVWGNNVEELSINIMAPFWKTPLAYVFFVMLLGLLFFVSWRWFLERERQRLTRQEEIKESKRLAELDKMKTRFFTNVSHEFRTPLTLILAPVEKLMHENSFGPEQFQYQTIQKNAKRLLILVNQLLDIKNLEKEGLQLLLSEGDIISFVEDNVRAFQSISQKKSIDLTFSANVRSVPTGFDADKLEKIIFNLLSNAFKFTPEGGSIHVGLEFRQLGLKEGVILIKFKDSGIGIEKEILDRIFDRYFTSESEENQGTGIGLSLVLEFVKLHGGTVKVESEKGFGSTFEVTLPLKIEKDFLVWEESYIENGKEEFINLDSTFSENYPSILLVEDNPDLRHYLYGELKNDYKVFQAANGKVALDLAVQHIPDLVISDLLMPVMDGSQLCIQLKENIKTSHIPVILLTAKTSEEDHLLGITSGCNLFIEKPFNLEILKSSLHNLLEERKRLQKHFRKNISVNTSELELESLDDKLIKSAVTLVEKEIENPDFSVEQLSKELGMSRVHLYKKINSLTGNSPLEFIRTIRLQRAAQLLEKQQFTVAEIAYKVGYNNAKYFSKHFKASYGTLPSQYVKKQE